LEIFDAYGVSQSPSFSGQPRPGDPPGYQAETSVATDWGWHPRVHWREGVRRYVEWFKASGR